MQEYHHSNAGTFLTCDLLLFATYNYIVTNEVSYSS